MIITLDKTYYARVDSPLLGYMGETESRTITLQGYKADGADRYILRLSYADGAQYDVDITSGEYTVQASLLRAAGNVKCQVLAVKSTGADTYEYVKKSNVFNVTIKPSVGGDTPVPTYEETVAVLDKVLAAEIAADECIAARDTAVTAAGTATDKAAVAVDKASEAAKSAEITAENASHTAADRATVETAKADVLSARDTAVSAADTAAEKAQTAIDSAATASTAAETAVTANNAAQTAKTAAEQAATEAEDNKTTAVNAAQTATQAAQAANNAADVAVSARDTAVSAQADVTAKAQTVATSAAQVAEDRQTVQSVAESIPTDYSTLSSDVEGLKDDLDFAYYGEQNLKDIFTWYIGAQWDGYFHFQDNGNSVITKPFLPNIFDSLSVKKVYEQTSYTISICESYYDENGNIVLSDTIIDLINQTSSVNASKSFAFDKTKKYSVLIRKTGSGVVVDKETALSYFDVFVSGKSIKKNSNNIEILERNSPINCVDKKIVLYGDSLFACSNEGGAWGGVLQEKFGFGEYVGVSIGGSKFITGNKVFLPNGFSIGDSFPKNIIVNSDGETKGDFSDWQRINTTIPSDADIIIIGTGANDVAYGEYWIELESPSKPGFLSGVSESSFSDFEWQTSEKFSTYNGDWDRRFLGGAIRSTIMKVQAKAPNAKIFVCNWCNSRGANGNIIGTSTKDYDLTIKALGIIKAVCSDFGIEMIDLFEKSGINPFNRNLWVVDSTHLTDDGYTQMMSKPIVTALRNYLQSQ